MTDETTTVGEETPEAIETPNREAAKYRKQLRDAEAERDALSARLQAAQRTIAESAAAPIIEKPGTLWTAGVNLDDLLDDDGNIDPRKVIEAATTTRDDLGLAKPANGPIVPSQGQHPEHTKRAGGWVGAFSGT